MISGHDFLRQQARVTTILRGADATIDLGLAVGMIAVGIGILKEEIDQESLDALLAYLKKLETVEIDIQKGDAN